MNLLSPTVKRASLVTSIFAIAALSLSGCSVDDSNIDGQATTEPTSATAEVDILPVNEKLAALVPAAYADRDRLVFGASEIAPYIKLDSDGSYSGLVIDLIDQLNSVLDINIVPETASFDTIMPSLQSGRLDVSGPAGDFVERQELVDFSDMAQSNVTILVKSAGGFQPTSIAELCGTDLGIQKGAGTQNVLDAVTAACTADGAEPVNITTYADLSAANLALNSDRVAAVVAPTAPNSLAASASDGVLAVIKLDDMQTLPAATATYGIQTMKDSGLAEAITAALGYLADEGVYTELFEKWDIPLSAIERDALVVNGSTQTQNG